MLHARHAIIYILLPGTNNNIHSSTSYYYSILMVAKQPNVANVCYEMQPNMMLLCLSCARKDSALARVMLLFVVVFLWY